jgi:hypothetical protein
MIHNWNRPYTLALYCKMHNRDENGRRLENDTIYIGQQMVRIIRPQVMIPGKIWLDVIQRHPQMMYWPEIADAFREDRAYTVFLAQLLTCWYS